MSKFYQFERQQKDLQQHMQSRQSRIKQPQKNYNYHISNSNVYSDKNDVQQFDIFKPKQIQKQQSKKQKQSNNTNLRKSLIIKDEEGQQLGWCHNCCACTKLQYYKQYFKVTNNDVFSRIKKNLFFWSGGFFIPQNQQYDFYGPFWIYTTIIFCISSVHNILKYQVQSSFQYNYSVVGIAFGFIYLLGFIFPVILTFVLKLLGGNHTHIQMICLYGYSMCTYIICLILCSINVCILHYILLIYGAGVKVAFIVKNIFQQTQIPTNKKLLIAILVIVEVAVQFLVIIFVFIICASPTPVQTQQHHNLGFIQIRQFQV